MKTLRFISTLVVLGLATVVTAGSLYVTASAAAQQESTDFDPAVADASSVPAAPITVVDAVSSSLDKSGILKNFQSHVILDADGGFNGRFSALGENSKSVANISVRLAQHGAIIASTTTDASGRFSFTGLPEGVVAIMAEGPNSLAMFGLVLFGHGTAVPENSDLKAAGLELDMDSAVAAGADVATVKELLYSHVGSADRRFAAEVTAEDQGFSFGSGELSTTIRNRAVSLQEDGTLRGEISVIDERTGRLREVLDLTVHFVRNGVRVASSEVSNDGGFIANGLTPGVHSIVVVGQDGVMVSNVEIVGTTYEGNTVQDSETGDYTPVRKVATSLKLVGGFGGSTVGAGNAGAFGSGSGGGGGQGAGSGAPLAGAGSPLGGGGGGGFPGGGGFSGGGGGFSGGGGGFGGGSGLGALLAGGIGGALGYLAGDNNNDKPASPQ